MGFLAAVEETNQDTENIPDFSASASAKEAADAADQGADAMDALVERLRALEPPPDITRGHEGVVQFVQSLADRSHTFSNLLRQGDPKALAAYRYSGSSRAAPGGPYPLGRYITPSPSAIRNAQIFASEAAEGGYDIGLEEGALPGVSP